MRLMLQNYKQLSKMRLSLLVVSTAAAGYAAGSKESIDWAGMGWTTLGTMMASSSANALNQVYERFNDGLMKRTMNRPLPTGRMSRAHALVFAALAGGGGVWLLAEKVGPARQHEEDAGRACLLCQCVSASQHPCCTGDASPVAISWVRLPTIAPCRPTLPQRRLGPPT